MAEIVDLKILIEKFGKVSRVKKYDYESNEVTAFLQKFFTEVKKDLTNFKGQTPAAVMKWNEIQELALLARTDINTWEEYVNDYKDSKQGVEVHAVGTAKECIVRFLRKLGNENKPNFIYDKDNKTLYIVLKDIKL